MRKIALVFLGFIGFTSLGYGQDVENVKKIFLDYELQAWEIALPALRGNCNPENKEIKSKDELISILESCEKYVGEIKTAADRNVNYFKGFKTNENSIDLFTNLTKIRELVADNPEKVNSINSIKNSVKDNFKLNSSEFFNKKNVEYVIDKLNKEERLEEISKLEGKDYSNVKELKEIAETISADNQKKLNTLIKKWNKNNSIKISDNLLGKVSDKDESNSKDNIPSKNNDKEENESWVDKILLGLLILAIPAVILGRRLYNKKQKENEASDKNSSQSTTNLPFANSSKEDPRDQRIKALEAEVNSLKAKCKELQEALTIMEEKQNAAGVATPTTPAPAVSTATPVYIQTQTTYALNPTGNVFQKSALHTKPEGDYYYILNTQGNAGTFEVTDKSDMQQMAAQSANAILKNVCDFDNLPRDMKSGIQTLQLGKIVADGENWKVTLKAKIKFV